MRRRTTAGRCGVVYTLIRQPKAKQTTWRLHHADFSVILKVMPGSMEFLRVILGLIGIGCSYMAARAFVLARRGYMKQTRVTGWLIRLLLCLAALVFRHAVDMLDIAVWTLVVAAAVLACWIASRPPRQEDLTDTMFQDR